MEWLTGSGADVFIPLGHSPDYDLIADMDGRLLRVQVKTSSSWHAGRWVIALCTRGGNRSWNGITKRFGPDRADFVFAHVADGRRWFIPSQQIGGETAVVLGGPKYAEYEVEPGRPLSVAAAA
jgi:hypothetical protein